MRRILVLLATMVTGVLLASGVALAQAEVNREHFTIPYEDLTLENPCTGEQVRFISGEVHIFSHQTFTPSGAARQIFRFNAQNVTAIGLSTGDTYRVAEATQITDTFAESSTHTFTYRFLVVSTGASPNWIVTYTVHFTENDDGTRTAEFERIETECKG